MAKFCEFFAGTENPVALLYKFDLFLILY